MANPEKTIKPEAGNEGPRRQEIEKRFDELRAENERLLGELGRYKYRIFAHLFSERYVDTPEMKQAIADWIAQVERDTSYLRPLNELGIRVFNEDPADQPAFPEVKITFGSKRVAEANLGDLNSRGGFVSGGEGIIEIGAEALPLATRVAYFLENGELDRGTADLVHELIHWDHYMRSARRKVNAVLTESHAYLSGSRYGYRDEVNVERIHGELTKNPMYEFESIEAFKGLSIVSGLRALGVSEAELATLVAESSYDKDANHFSLIEKRLEGLRDQLRITDEEIGSLGELCRMDEENQVRKAQWLLYRILESRFDMKELRNYIVESLRKGIYLPNYQSHGKWVPARDLRQNMVCPANEEWPYDPEGLRTGVLFGYVETPQGKHEYGIGRLEATADDSRLDLASNRAEQEKWLSVLRGQAGLIEPENKRRLLIDFIFDGDKNDLSKRVVKSLVSNEEAARIVKEISPQLAEHFSALVEATGIANWERPGWVGKEQMEKRIEAYSAYVGFIGYFFRSFGIRLDDLDAGASDAFRGLRRNLSRMKSIYRNQFGGQKNEVRKAA